MWQAFINTWKTLGSILAFFFIVGLLAGIISGFIWLAVTFNPLWGIGAGVIGFCYLWALTYLFQESK